MIEKLKCLGSPFDVLLMLIIFIIVFSFLIIKSNSQIKMYRKYKMESTSGTISLSVVEDEDQKSMSLNVYTFNEKITPKIILMDGKTEIRINGKTVTLKELKQLTGINKVRIIALYNKEKIEVAEIIEIETLD